MADLLTVVLPVFLVIGFGYLAAALGLFGESAVDGLMKFAQNFAIPCLLFRAISTLDVGGELDPAMLAAFYTGATSGFLAGLAGARLLFARPWEDAVAFGFAGLFSNSVLLGLPISERAFGAATLPYNYMIIAFHAPFCYALGMTVMEVLRNRGASLADTARRVLAAMFRNAILIGIALGFLWNLGDLPTPTFAAEALDLMARAGLPAALFGLGGVLHRYRPEGDLRAIAWVASVSLVLHPAITLGLSAASGLGVDATLAAVLTAAMAPGVNAYVFANIYGVARRVVASAVLLATAASVITSWLWLLVLP